MSLAFGRFLSNDPEKFARFKRYAMLLTVGDADEGSSRRFCRDALAGGAVSVYSDIS